MLGFHVSTAGSSFDWVLKAMSSADGRALKPSKSMLRPIIFSVEQVRLDVENRMPGITQRDNSDSSQSFMDKYKPTQKSSGAEKATSTWRGIMRGHVSEILLAALVLIIPMLVLTVVLLSLVYTHLMPDYRSTYSIKGENRTYALGGAYYINYSATRLVFISSVSSTLAPFLISAAMILFSYPLAHSFSKNSDRATASKLPSPYQLELIIEAIDARLKSLWNMLLYICSSKRTRIAVIPDLWRSMGMLMSLGILAVLTSLADVWLHVATTSVQYEQIRPDVTVPDFAPGRGLSASCLNRTANRDSGSGMSATGCVVQSAGSGGGGGLENQTEFIRTAGNESLTSRIYLSNQGHAVIGPAPNSMPADVDFSASSFGSRTLCRMATKECGTHFIKPGAEVSRDISYNCNTTMAGFKASGNFSNLFATGSDDRNDKNTANSILGAGAAGGNTGSLYSMGFRFFRDSAMTNASDTNSNVPDSLYTPRLYWSFAFALDSGWSTSWSTDRSANTASTGVSQGEYDPRNMIGMVGGGIGGIMSCTTNLSDVDFSFKNGAMLVDKATPMNETTPLPFLGALAGSFGLAQMKSGLELAVAGSVVPSNASDAFPLDPVSGLYNPRNIKPGAGDDIASGFAMAFDRTLVALPAGVLVPKPATNLLRRATTLVTRMPKAPLMAVVVTNLLYAVLGLGLTVMALVSLRLGQGVKDAQARLGSAAVVAQAFEDERLGADAKGVEDLYEERRGKGTGRVAIVKRRTGGRLYAAVQEEGH